MRWSGWERKEDEIGISPPLKSPLTIHHYLIASNILPHPSNPIPSTAVDLF